MTTRQNAQCDSACFCGASCCCDDERLFPVMIGEKVTDRAFEVYQSGKFVKTSLAKLYKKGWVVLFFYPADFTFVCPTELEDLQSVYAKLKNMGVEVVSVSTDTVFVHKAWHDTSAAIKKVAYPMAADPTGTLARDFGVYVEDEGVALRGTFVINPQGTLVAMEVHDNSIGRNVEELVRKIQAAQFVASHNGQVCPAKWQPGDKALTPGVRLVGKI